MFYVVHGDHLYTYTAPFLPDWNEAESSRTTLTNRNEDEEGRVGGETDADRGR